MKMSHKIALFFMVSLLSGCVEPIQEHNESPHKIEPVESGTVLVKKWVPEKDKSVLNTGPKDNLNSVHIKEQNKWDEWNKTFQKDYSKTPNGQTEYFRADRFNK